MVGTAARETAEPPRGGDPGALTSLGGGLRETGADRRVRCTAGFLSLEKKTIQRATASQARFPTERTDPTSPGS